MSKSSSIKKMADWKSDFQWIPVLVGFRQSNNKYMQKGAKGKGAFTSDIGIKSEGFAPIFTLALIISLGAILVAYILWRI